MVVVIVSLCPPKLKGDLSKWLYEVFPRVYVGTISARVREYLWKRVISMIGSGKALMIFSAQNEQKMDYYTIGTSWVPRDYDGISLMKHLKSPSEKNSTYSESYIVMDIETTGLDPERDWITQIACILVKNGKITDTFNQYILLEKEVEFPKSIQELTGISIELLNQKGEARFKVLSECKNFLRNYPIVFHNAEFDLSFLKKEFKEVNIEIGFSTVIDTLKLARNKKIEISNYRLSTLADYFDLDYKNQHSALEDVIITMQVLEKLKEI